MKFSVIIPAHNEEQYISSSLRAILEQTHADFEVIVVDNASTDKTYDVANEYVKGLHSSGNLPVRIIVLQENQKGTMAACEKGRSVATGDIIARLDADCVPDRDWLEKAAKIFLDERVVVVSGPYSFYDSTKFFNAFKIWQQKYIMGSVISIMQLFHKGAVTNGGNSLFRASTLEKIGGFDTSIVFYGDDTNIARRMSKLGKLAFSHELIMPTSARRYKKGGGMRTQAKYVFHYLKESFWN